MRAAATTDDVVGWLRAERALDVRALDVGHLSKGAMGETLVFATARSKAHMLRVAKAVRHEMKHRGVQVENNTGYGPPTIEGTHSEDWLLIDSGDVVVCIMIPTAREDLRLEEHWQKQGAAEIDLPPDPYSKTVEEGALGAVAAAAAAAPAPGDVYREEGDELGIRELELVEEKSLDQKAAASVDLEGDLEGEGEYEDEEYASEYAYADEYEYSIDGEDASHDGGTDSYTDGHEYDDDAYLEYYEYYEDEDGYELDAQSYEDDQYDGSYLDEDYGDDEEQVPPAEYKDAKPPRDPRAPKPGKN